jgi:hypothetical protein
MAILDDSPHRHLKKASGELQLVKLPFKINLTPSPNQSSSHRRSDLNKQKGKKHHD